jgi:hypothetical protein
VRVEHRGLVGSLQELTANDRLEFLMKQTEIYAHFVKDKKSEDKKAKSVQSCSSPRLSLSLSFDVYAGARARV